ncbi:MAG: hypothetical protein WBJ83_00555 [Thermacetogeniaceae bacterium]|nr:hypothetical protein [Syntrophomonadaceae bacterium]
MAEKGDNGIYCDGQRLIYVTYSFEDYQTIWGGSLSDYKDFLLARQRKFQQLQEEHFGAWIVLVPFDRKDFSSWLEENPLYKQCSNQHAHWALRVASDPSHLEKIRKRHPLQNYILKDESLKAILFAWFLPVIAPNASSMRKLREPIPQQLVNQIRQELITGLLAPLPQFQRYSTTRGTGVALLPGDRFVHADTIDQISEHTIESLLQTWDSCSPYYFSISKQYSFPICPHWHFPRVAVLCFPLIVLGCAFDCETVTIRISRADSKDLPLHIWKNYFQYLNVSLYPGRGTDFAAAGFTKHIYNEIQRELTSEAELLEPSKYPAYLWRVK